MNTADPVEDAFAEDAEDIEDNDDAIVGTILSRRALLQSMARAGSVLTLGGLLAPGADAAYQRHAQKTVKLVASPAVTEGPFFVDKKLRRSDLRVGTGRASVVDGVPLDLTLSLHRLTGGRFAPLQGAVVDVWQADAQGVYSDKSHPMNHENTAGQTWLRGYQVSDGSGLVRFKTIVPGWYPSRTTHIHFKVRQGTGKTTREFTSQLFFDDKLADRIFAQTPYRVRDARQVRNASDMVYNERVHDGTRAGDHLLLTVKPAAGGRGYVASLGIALTDENLRTGQRRRGGPGGPPPGGFGGPPPGGLGGPPPGWGPDDF